MLAGSVDHTGGTTVEDGTLAVDGTLTGDVSVLPAGTLGVGGTVAGSVDVAGRVAGGGTVTGAITVRDGGSIAPGNSVGTIAVGGDFRFGPGARHEVEVTADGVADRVEVAGAARIDGGTLVVIADPAYVPRLGERLAFLSADGGITGRHAALEGSLFDGTRHPFLATGLDHDGGTASLLVERSALSFAAAGATGNQRAVGRALDGLAPDAAPVAPLLGESLAGYRRAADSLSGEIHASVRSALVVGARPVRSAVADRVEAAFGLFDGEAAGAAPGPPSRRLSGIDGAVWASATGLSATLDGTGEASDLSLALGGFLAGLDVALGPSGRVGLAAGYQRNAFDGEGAAGSGDVDSFVLAAYGGLRAGLLTAMAGGTVAFSDVSTERTALSGTAGAERLSAAYHATTAQLFGRASVRLPVAPAEVAPFAEAALVHVDTGSLAETGGAAALASEGESGANVLTVLGVDVGRTFAVGGALVRPFARAGWEHAFGEVVPEAELSFRAGGDPFAVAGTPIARDAAVLGAGLEIAPTGAFALSVRYDGRIGGGTSEHAGSGRLSIAF